MAGWTAFPFAGEYNFDASSVKKKWSRLHAGDLEPLPKEVELLEAWALFHNGEFQQAYSCGLKIGLAGMNVAHKAACVYANYLETHETCRMELFLDVVKRTEQQITQDADNVNAYYWHAYALARYSQGISVAKALAQGIGGKVKANLETVIRRQPKHPDAHIALGTFHAEVIDKVGSLIGAMAYGAHRDIGMNLFAQALKLHVDSPTGMVEYAKAMLMFDGDKMSDEATRLFQQVVQATPQDALDRINIDLAQQQLTNSI